MNDGYNYKKIGLLLTCLMAVGFSKTAYADYEPANSDFIDISNHQKDLPQSFFNGLPKQGVSGIALKVSEGDYYVDAYARNNIARSRAAGVKVSAYHFSHFENNAQAKAEAAFFDRLLVGSGFNKSQDGYVVLDIENPNSVSPETLTQAANTFVNELKAKGYPRVDIYVGDYYLRSELIASKLVVKDPWVAAYPDYPDQHVSSVAHKGGMGAWQFADNGWIDGYNGILDVSVDYSGKYTANSGSIYYEGKSITGSKKVTINGLDIYDRPGKTAHSKVVGNTKNYLGKKVDFTKEVRTDKGIFKQFKINNKVIGFVSEKAFSDFDTIIESKPVDYKATVRSKNDGVRTLPHGMENSKLIMMTSDIFNQEFHITEEVKVSNGTTWLKLEKEGKIVGYVDKDATVLFTTMTENPANYVVEIITKNDGIRTLPHGMRYSDLIEMTAKVKGQEFDVVAEAQTSSGITWLKLEKDGKFYGYVDKVAAQKCATMTEKSVSYGVKIVTSNDGIRTLPHGVGHSKLITMTSKVKGQEFKVVAEAVTSQGITWLKLEKDGKFYGYVDKVAVEKCATMTEKPVSYGIKIVTPNDGIRTLPYGVYTSKLITMTSKVKNQEFKVIAEAQTSLGRTWLKLEKDGKFYGYVDKIAVQKGAIMTEKAVSYAVKIVTPNDGVRTLPYGVFPSKLITMTSKIKDQEFKVTAEAQTSLGRTWLKLEKDGKFYGYVDKVAVQKCATMTEKPVSYSVKIVTSNDGVRTLPYGVYTSKLITMTSNVKGQDFKVVAEAQTSLGRTWLKLEKSGKIYGYVDQVAVQKTKEATTHTTEDKENVEESSIKEENQNNDVEEATETSQVDDMSEVTETSQVDDMSEVTETSQLDDVSEATETSQITDDGKIDDEQTEIDTFLKI